MSCKFEGSDKSILEFRPNISFVEPDQEPGVIEGVDHVQLEDVQDERDKIKKLAKAVNTLAAAVQSRANQRAAGMYINLDKNVDQDTIQAMRRRFPDADPTKITYDQYRECKDGLRAKGAEIAKQGLPEIRSRDEVGGETGISAGDGTGGAGGAGDISSFVPGDFDSQDAAHGGLRPELNANAHIIPPVDIEDIQIKMICILVNFIWKNFIKKGIVKAAGWPVGKIFKALPDKLCNPGTDIEIPGLFILGDKLPDLLSGKPAEEAKKKF